MGDGDRSGGPHRQRLQTHIGKVCVLDTQAEYIGTVINLRVDDFVYKVRVFEDVSDIAVHGQRYATPPFFPSSDSYSETDSEEEGEWRPEFSSGNRGQSSVDSVKAKNSVAVADGDVSPLLNELGNDETKTAERSERDNSVDLPDIEKLIKKLNSHIALRKRHQGSVLTCPNSFVKDTLQLQSGPVSNNLLVGLQQSRPITQSTEDVGCPNQLVQPHCGLHTKQMNEIGPVEWSKQASSPKSAENHSSIPSVATKILTGV